MSARPGRLAADERGFTLVELLLSTLIMLAVTAAIFSIVDPAQGSYRTQPEVADMQQRLRVGASALQQDLLMAGAGPFRAPAGAPPPGSLLAIMAPVLPYRVGAAAADPDAGVFYRDDAVSLVYVAQNSAQTTVSAPMPPQSAELEVVDAKPGCPAGVDAETCGFQASTRALIFDGTGAYDVFTITQVQSSNHLQHTRDTLSKRYEQDASVVSLQAHTYYLRSDPDTDTFQLRHYDGVATDLPMVDNVVGLAFEYFGDPHGPVLYRPVTDPVGPWVSYGPRPPAPGVVQAGGAWPAGENCAFRVGPGGQQVSRLEDLSPGDDALVPLTPAMLTDGPWCPDAAAPARFDADLLRIRTIRVRLRVQVAAATLRGPAGVLFSRGGAAAAGVPLVPDQEVRFDVSPRNMNLAR